MNIIKESLVKLHFFHKISPKENKYLILLFSLLSLILLSPIFKDSSRLQFSILISMVLMSGIYADYERKRFDYIEIGIGFLALIVTWCDYFIEDIAWLDAITQFIYIFYFLYYTIELIIKIVISREVSVNLVNASIVGFLMLGLCGAMCASLLEATIATAYKLPENITYHQFENFVYYSFVTITTVGYGDMLPMHPASKMLAIALCIAGHLYTTMVLGIIIGKFISGKQFQPRNRK